MSRLLLIGSGAWGQKYISTINNFSDVTLTIANRQNWKSLVDEKPDGVIVCTPPRSHIEIAKTILEKNIAVMIEKPLSLSLKESEVLKQYTAPILVNHIHLFSNKFQYIKNNINKSDIIHIESSGTNTSLERDYSELWDYGPHDISMILDLMEELPNNVICTQAGRRFTIELEFDRVQTKSIVGFNPRSRFLDVHLNNLSHLTYDRSEEIDFPLTNAIRIFIDAINGKSDYRLGLDLSIKVMQVLEMCQKSVELSS